MREHPSVRIAAARRFRGRFTLPGDKSISHRLALLAALAEGESRFANFSTADDAASTLSCLQGLGVAVVREHERVNVLGRGPEALRTAVGPLDAGNSGSTLRMLAGVVAGRPFQTVLTGDASLRRRPVERVAEPLRAMGARAVSTSGRPPLTIEGGGLTGVRWELPVASAQVKTAVLLAGLQARGTTTVVEPMASRDHTERLLPIFGVPVRRERRTASVEGGAALRPVEMTVPGDPSSAAFLVVAALVLPDSEVQIERVLLNPQRIGFLDVLKRMGARVAIEVVETAPEPVGSIRASSSRLHGTIVGAEEVPRLIDEVPALAVAAAHAEGELAVEGAGELRVKESDRIAAIADGLRGLGVEVEEHPEGLVVRGGRPLRGARVRAEGDHRIAMALSVAALATPDGAEVEGAECASVSFPEFFALLERGADRG